MHAVLLIDEVLQVLLDAGGNHHLQTVDGLRILGTVACQKAGEDEFHQLRVGDL